MRVREMMTEPVETIAPSMPLSQAAGLMRALRVHRQPRKLEIAP